MLNPLSLRKPYLDARIGSVKTTQTRILERPGLWMEETELAKLVEDIRSVVKTINIGGLEYGIAKGAKKTLDNAIITMIYDGPTGRPVAFNALSYMSCSIRNKEVPVIHLGLVVIDPTYRAKGLSWILYGLTTFLLFFKNKMRPLWISNVTQVPAIIGMANEGFTDVFPAPVPSSRRTYDHLILAREIMVKHRAVFGVGPEAEFDEEMFVIRNAYTGGSDNLKKTWETAPKHRNEIYNDFCAKHLDYSRGDDFLQLGQVSLQTFYAYLTHTIPGSSILVVIYQALFTLLESALVPAFHWFSPSKAMGVLRPRGKL